MKALSKLINLFGLDFEKANNAENLSNFVLSIEKNKIRIPTELELREAFNELPKRDNCILKVTFNNNDPIDINKSKPESIKDFIDQISSKNKILGEDIEQIGINLRIIKDHSNNIISIYSFKKFSEFIKSYDSLLLLRLFNNFFDVNDLLIFNCLEENIKSFNSKTIHFTKFSEISNKSSITNKQRKEFLEKRNEVCHFTDSSISYLLPIDFFLINLSEDQGFNEIFAQLSIILSIISIFDITSFRGDKFLDYKLNGYKSFGGSIALSSVGKISVGQYQKIFEWVYNTDNISDRLGLARNIISLNINEDITNLNETTYSSIKSAFEIYLKKNIQQYIEVKNKVSEFILDLSQKANHVVETMGSSFKNNLIALVSFFLSIIVVKAISTGKVQNIFLGDVYWISISIIIISYLYCAYSIFEIKRDRERYKALYISLKGRYRDILDNEDIERIFNNDIELNKDLKFIDIRTIWLAILWVLSLTILFITIQSLNAS